MRSFESSSIHLQQQQQSRKSNDYELKQVKEMYERKLAKLNEDLGKKIQGLREAEQ